MVRSGQIAVTSIPGVTIGVLLLVGPMRVANSQVLQGRLLDLSTNEPIGGGVVTLIPQRGDRTVSVVTDEEGMYELLAPRPGHYFIEARRLGYQVWIDGPIELSHGDVWQSEFHLSPLPVQLDPVEVTAPMVETEAFLRRVGFYDRRNADFGHFITRSDIDRRAPVRMSDLLSSIPGVRLIRGTGGLARSSISFRGSLLSLGGACHPRVFIDGLLVIRGDARIRGVDVHGVREQATEVRGSADPAQRPEIALDDVVMPRDVQGVEVYRRASEVPVRFGGTSTATQCGVIVIWTRRGWQRTQ